MAFGVISRNLSVWRAAWEAERGQAVGAIPGGHHTEFLPAAGTVRRRRRGAGHRSEGDHAEAVAVRPGARRQKCEPVRRFHQP